MNWKIPLFKTYWDEDDIEAVNKVIRRGTFWTTGPEIKEFESKLLEYVGGRYAVTFNSGTSALHSVLLAHDVDGSEVIVPSFTFIATANCVVLAGGRPVFAEIENQSYGLDSEDVKEKITSKTKAIIPVHYGGGPCKEISALREIANDNKLLLIEDAAESLGAKVGNQKVGTLGDSAMFSLCQGKVISTAEGGFIVTDSEIIYNKLKLMRSHGRVEKNQDYFLTTEEMDYIQIGYNYRMPTMCAALGISQLHKIDKNIEKRRGNAGYLTKKLSKVNGIFPPKSLDKHFHVYQMYTVQLENNKIRDELQRHLTENRIQSKVYFNPIHLKTLYRDKYGYKEGDLPRTEDVSKKVLTLPMYPNLSQEYMDFIIEKICGFFGG